MKQGPTNQLKRFDPNGQVIVIKENAEAAIIVWNQDPIYESTFDIDIRWATHILEKETGARFLGHYDMTLHEALDDAHSRILL